MDAEPGHDVPDVDADTEPRLAGDDVRRSPHDGAEQGCRDPDDRTGHDGDGHDEEHVEHAEGDVRSRHRVQGPDAEKPEEEARCHQGSVAGRRIHPARQAAEIHASKCAPSRPTVAMFRNLQLFFHAATFAAHGRIR